ncbi:hypothetical protein J2792_000636 [Novosphingobium capsulatum]|uniref:Uncharacterized protein n=1 Tax=Novosphingobium capsulatum TaxID=13688 RepID=A0ABU1MI97_9SPHN|nr:hypothetical protein [Novosphingobium capsulatum]
MARGYNGLGRGIRVAENVGGGNANHAKPVAFHPRRTPGISKRASAHVMRNPVDLEDSSRRSAIEISDKAAHRVLSAQLDSRRPLPKALP